MINRREVLAGAVVAALIPSIALAHEPAITGTLTERFAHRLRGLGYRVTMVEAPSGPDWTVKSRGFRYKEPPTDPVVIGESAIAALALEFHGSVEHGNRRHVRLMGLSRIPHICPDTFQPAFGFKVRYHIS
jgi:hypothetical protein